MLALLYQNLGLAGNAKHLLLWIKIQKLLNGGSESVIIPYIDSTRRK
jgi:hypothetical protein